MIDKRVFLTKESEKRIDHIFKNAKTKNQLITMLVTEIDFEIKRINDLIADIDMMTGKYKRREDNVSMTEGDKL